MEKKKYLIFLVVFASLAPLFISIKNKSSAVAEMGDRARAKRAEKCGAVVPLSVERGAVSPSNTMSPGRGLTSYQVAS